MTRKISANFVPVAVNTRKMRDKTVDTPATRLFRDINRQQSQTQGVWIVTPEGKVLGGYHGPSDVAERTRGFIETIDAGLKTFGEVKPRTVQPMNPHPHRGVGIQPDGSAALAIYVRGVRRDKTVEGGPPARDTVTLSKKEWEDLVPPKVEVGCVWTVSGSVTRKFCLALSPVSDHSYLPQPEDATVAKLTGVVEALDGGVARIRLSGALESNTPRQGERDKQVKGAATVEGVAHYDVGKKEMRSVLLIFDGTFRFQPPHDKSALPINSLAEWRAEAKPGD